MILKKLLDVKIFILKTFTNSCQIDNLSSLLFINPSNVNHNYLHERSLKI